MTAWHLWLILLTRLWKLFCLTDAVITCCDWDPDPLCIVESDELCFSALNYIIAISRQQTLSDIFTRGEGWCFVGESSLKSQSGALIIAMIFCSAVYTFPHLSNSVWFVESGFVWEIEHCGRRLWMQNKNTKLCSLNKNSKPLTASHLSTLSFYLSQ